MTREEAIERMMATIDRLLRKKIFFHLPDEGDDVIQEALLAGLIALEKGRVIRCPEAWVWTVVRKQIAKVIDQRVKRRLYEDVDAIKYTLGYSQDFDAELANREAIAAGLDGPLLGDEDRELLTRAYIRGEDPARIRREMRLTATRYRLTKSIAKQQFGRNGRRAMKGLSRLRVVA